MNERISGHEAAMRIINAIFSNKSIWVNIS